MSDKFELVKNYLLDLDLKIVHEDPEEELVIVEDPENGIQNLIVDCEEPIVILEQVIMEVPQNPGDFFKRLLQMNRTLVHGAFCLDEDGKLVLFRDTLQLENLDLNEMEGSIHALSLALAEYSGELLSYAGKQ
ncbi:MAG: molecular chaperone Tir [Calditrichaeota bacterium]|nr:MAG: molecular chaperone Tir [Calditrichota bacterium]